MDAVNSGELQANGHPRLVRGLRAALDALCFAALVLTMATVIWGLVLRATFETSYAIGAAVAILGAVVVIVALAQQAIAGRDRATWREMAVWQIRSAKQKLEDKGIRRSVAFEELLGGEGTPYYEHLIATLIEDMRRAGDDLALDEDAGPDGER